MFNFNGYFNWNEKPPTLKHIMDSIVNYDRDKKVGLSELALLGHDKIFSFDYNLDESLFTKDEFECSIINHFIDRRIGYETVGAFKLKLQVKILEILPQINLLIKTYDEIKNSGLINKEIRTKTENNLYNKNQSITSDSETTIDNRYSNTPQNKIEDVKNGEYMSDYSFNTNTNNSNNNLEDESSDNLSLTEEKIKIDSDSVLKSLQVIENIKNIYSFVFEELECLFYNLI